MGQEISVSNIANIAAIGGLTVEEILDKMAAKGIGIAGGAAEIPDYSDILTGTVALGSTVSMGGHEWVVCHIDYNGKMFVLMDTIIESTTAFGSTTNYPGSTLAGVAKNFENSLPSNVLAKLLTVNVSGVSAKVFVPSHAQLNGGFNLFTSNSTDANRIGYYNGAATNWWTSSPYSSSSVYYVTADGGLDNDYPSTTGGFRPCVALPL